MGISRSDLSTDFLSKVPFSLRQSVLGTAYLLIPRRIPGLLPLVAATLRDLPHIRRSLLPSPADALDLPDGLCGLAGQISVAELLEGYRRGMYVMSHIGPLKWWAPRHRMVQFFDRTRVEKSTRRRLRSGQFRITFDTAFSEVVRACAGPREHSAPLTWITPQIRTLFDEAHVKGYAHSVEAWDGDTLVGGVYGLAVGRVFFTESQFHRARDASKVAFAVLSRHLQAWGYALNDGKHPSRHLAACGMVPVTRDEFSMLTERYGSEPSPVEQWRVDPDLLSDCWNPAEAAGIRMADVLPGGSACTWSVDELLTTRRSPTW